MKDLGKIFLVFTPIGLKLVFTYLSRSLSWSFYKVESSQCKLNSVINPISIVVAAFIKNRTSYPVRLARSKPSLS